MFWQTYVVLVVKLFVCNFIIRINMPLLIRISVREREERERESNVRIYAVDAYLAVFPIWWKYLNYIKHAAQHITINNNSSGFYPNYACFVLIFILEFSTVNVNELCCFCSTRFTTIIFCRSNCRSRCCVTSSLTYLILCSKEEARNLYASFSNH